MKPLNQDEVNNSAVEPLTTSNEVRQEIVKEGKIGSDFDRNPAVVRSIWGKWLQTKMYKKNYEAITNELIKQYGQMPTIEEILDSLNNNAEEFRSVKLTKDNWVKDFKNNIVQTPIGKFRIADFLYDKLISEKRQHLFGLMKPTLNNPDYVFVVRNEDGSYATMFLKAFIGENRQINLFSFIKYKDNSDLIVSLHERSHSVEGLLKRSKLFIYSRVKSPAGTGHDPDKKLTDSGFLKHSKLMGLSEIKNIKISADTLNENEIKNIMLSANELTIDIKTELKSVRINKEDIVKISKYYAFTKENKLDTALKTIELIDGSEFIGHIRSQDSLSLKFETQSGTMIDIKRDQIENIEDQRSDFLIGDDPNKTRLFFAPTGRSLKAGTGYFSVNELLFPILAFGITDYLSLAGGMTIFPGVGVSDQLYYLNGKARVLNLEDFDLSAGILYTNITTEEENLTTIYANSTYGTRDAALTLTAGLSVSGTENSGQYPIFIIGGELKLSNSAKLISENLIPTSPESGKIFSLGVRFFGKKVAGDFGLIYFVDEDGESIRGWPFVPWVGLSYNF